MIIEIIKDAFKIMGTIMAVLLVGLILMIPCFIGIVFDSIPTVLFGIIFFIGFAVAITKKVIEKEMEENND